MFLDTGSPTATWAVRPDGQGDVTETPRRLAASATVPAMCSPVVGDGRIFMVSDGGVATCFDTKRRKTLWR